MHDTWCLEKCDPEKMHTDEHASWSMQRASCTMHHAPCIMHQASCIMHHASWIRIMNIWISTSFIISKLRPAWPVLNDLNLGPSVRLFDTFKMYISEHAGTVLSGIQNLCWVTDDRIIFYGSAKSEYWNFNFCQQVLQVGLIDRPGHRLQIAVCVLIFEIIV